MGMPASAPNENGCAPAEAAASSSRTTGRNLTSLRPARAAKKLHLVAFGASSALAIEILRDRRSTGGAAAGHYTAGSGVLT
jgi:hypothetical protein